MDPRYLERHTWWTEERTATLRRMWEQGDSATMITTCLGAGTTRNAIIGKAHRLKLGTHPKNLPKAPAALPDLKKSLKVTRTVQIEPHAKVFKGAGRVMARFFGPAIAASAKQTAVAAIVPVQKPQAALVVSEKPFTPVEKRLSLLQLNESVCKWPIGDPHQKGFYFCGQQSEAHMPYCRYHNNEAYYYVSKRKRRIAA
jgi:GcrA cell cycle regulator